MTTAADRTFCPQGHRIVQSTGECASLLELGRGRYQPVTGPCEDILDQQEEAAEQRRAPGGALLGAVLALGLELGALIVGWCPWTLRALAARLWSAR